MNAKRTNKPPVAIIKRGSVAVRIFDKSDNYPYYRVSYHSGGERTMLTFTDLGKAQEEAEIRANQLSRGDGLAATLKGRDQVIYTDATMELQKLNHKLQTDKPIRLDAAAKEYAEAKELLPEKSLRDAVEFYRKFFPKDVEPRPISQVIAELLEQRGSEGCSEAYLKDLKLRLQRFEKSFNCPINSLTPRAVSIFLEGLEYGEGHKRKGEKVGARHRNNYRRVIQTLLKFAQQQGYLPEEVDMMKGVRRVRELDEEVQVFTPDEFSFMLAAASHQLLPVLVLGGLCGLRNAEIRRLNWADVKWDEGHVEIKKGTAKTRARRTAPISDNAAAWLSGYTEATGGVWTIAESVLNRAFRDLAKNCEVEGGWKHNGLRHSFCSYRAALTKNMNQTAFEAGNSPAMILRHYWKTVSEGEAKQWFNIMPKQPANVLQIKTAANG
jgi:integrase